MFYSRKAERDKENKWFVCVWHMKPLALDCVVGANEPGGGWVTCSWAPHLPLQHANQTVTLSRVTHTRWVLIRPPTQSRQQHSPRHMKVEAVRQCGTHNCCRHHFCGLKYAWGRRLIKRGLISIIIINLIIFVLFSITLSCTVGAQLAMWLINTKKGKGMECLLRRVGTRGQPIKSEWPISSFHNRKSVFWGADLPILLYLYLTRQVS